MKRVYISQRITQQLITTKDFARQPMIGVELEVAFVLSPTTDTYTCLHLSHTPFLLLFALLFFLVALVC